MSNTINGRHALIPAVYMLFKDSNKVLLLKRANTGYRDGYYSLPSGHLDGGEPAILAAVREAKEEVGVNLDQSDLVLVHTQHCVAEEGSHERINLYFEVKKWQGDLINAEQEKCDEIRWFEIHHLPEKLVPELTYFFENYDSNTAYGHFRF